MTRTYKIYGLSGKPIRNAAALETHTDALDISPAADHIRVTITADNPGAELYRLLHTAPFKGLAYGKIIRTKGELPLP